jgi:NADH:ubiquinone oxidoreductase subunit 5 (subunit L)/multisubunit Na+/H+ antiporter MnhA subunit
MASEMEMWPFLADELGQDGVPDSGMPKSHAEFLVSGSAFSPSGSPQSACTVQVRVGSLEKALYNKWYVDEVYDRVVVRPVGFLSRAQWAFDRGIDLMVDFSGRMAQSLGLWLGRLQTGFVNTYAFVTIVGVLLLLGGFLAF